MTGPRWRPGTLGTEAQAAHSPSLADCRLGLLAGPPTDLPLHALALRPQGRVSSPPPRCPLCCAFPSLAPSLDPRPPPPRSQALPPRDSFSSGAESLFTSAAQGDSICVKSPNASADQ